MAVTESSATETTEGAEAGAPTRLFGPRGRHRRPRPRKVLLAAGGLALAAGALSLVRLTPESGLGGLGTPGAEPRLDPSGDSTPATDRATNAAATVGETPQVSPSATTVMGGLSATPTAPPRLVSTTSPTTTPASPRDPATTIPEAPNTITPQPQPTTTTPQPPVAAPTPAPSGPPNTPGPQPSPSPSDPPGVCVPIIGLCVDPLSKHHDHPSATTASRPDA
ncbi:hypothetical protein [Streptomyces cupreus]|uniref:Uncharacterized protein n=1 Tax=Streptomyces cupreus TaxID=2759956 RepID=A0A7X1IZP1_9ACTN|nr:hypothetical protein [Streptomyces cupreus]MBC2900860.1 hypothetical protein [Streptomyces cupreus]